MEDPHAAVHQALYARIGSVPDRLSADSPDPDSSWSGLFTRPATLAIKDEERGGMPLRALNRACRIMLERTSLPDPDDNRYLDSVADACGFPDSAVLTAFFLEATGWNPLDWIERFGSEREGREET